MKNIIVVICLLMFGFGSLYAQVDSTKRIKADSIKIIKEAKIEKADSIKTVKAGIADSIKVVKEIKADSTKIAKDSVRLMKHYYPFGSNRLYPFKGKNRVYSFDIDTLGRQTRLVPSLIVPLSLIGYGLTTFNGNGIYSSYRAHNDVLRFFSGAQSSIDNILIYTPYVELAALILLKVRSRDDLLNTSLLIVKAEILCLALTYSLKYIVREERPYSYDLGQQGVPLADRKKDKNAFVSFPSGHTAQAFCAATIVFREYRYKSPWYGIGAYALATATGLYRMINNQHWVSDVLVGAGIGILSANMAYAFHEHRWGKKAVVMAPAFDGNYKGFSLVYNF